MSHENNTQITIKAVGDILLSDGYFDIGYGVGSQIMRRTSFFPFEKIKEHLQGADMALGNLECCISNTTARSGLRAKEFLASPDVTASLVNAGFNILLVANNHVLQHGPSAYFDTINYLNASGIKTVGHIAKGNSSQALTRCTVRNKTVGFLGYSMAIDEHNPAITEYAYCPKRDTLLQEIKKHRNECDFLILLLHWGDEFVSFPSKYQIDMAHTCVDEGVDAIIGGHSHVLQGIEKYKNKTIAYSLGNFVFNMPAPMCRHTAILSLTIDSDGSQESHLQPVWINQFGQPVIPHGPKLDFAEKNIRLSTKNINNTYTNNDDYYNKAVEEGLSIHRKWQKLHFVKNIHRIDKRWIIQMIFEFMERRLKEYRERDHERFICLGL